MERKYSNAVSCEISEYLKSIGYEMYRFTDKDEYIILLDGEKINGGKIDF